MPPQECKICYEAVEVLAIWGKLFYNLVVCPGCGLLFLLQKTVTDFDGIWEVSKLASDKRIKVTLACSECKQRNYNTMKNKKNDPDRLEMNKYCRFCKKHTSHKETK